MSGSSCRVAAMKPQTIAAAMLDVLWNPSLYERLSTAWQLDTDRASQGITWIIHLVERAIQQGRRPAP